MVEEQSEYERQKQIVWNGIRSLPDGEHILGRQLREMSGIKDNRVFYKLIEEFRESGIFIGANKQTPKGYYEIRTNNDMDRFTSFKRSELIKELEAVDEIERKWYSRNNPNYLKEDGA